MPETPPRLPHLEGIDAPGRDHTTYILARQDPEWRRQVRHYLGLLYMLYDREWMYLATFHPEEATWAHAFYHRLPHGIDTLKVKATPGWQPTDRLRGRRLGSLLEAMRVPELTDDQRLRPTELAHVRRLRAQMQHPDHPPQRVNRPQLAWWQAIVHGTGTPPDISV